MADTDDTPKPDLRKGLPFRSLPDRTPIAGRVDDEDVVVVRQGAEVFAVGAHCTHYHGPLAEGLVVGDTLRCPWHHACFSLRSGEPLRAPALDPIACWRVERDADTVFVREKLTETPKRRPSVPPDSVLILGGGAAGLAAAEMLRREGYDGSVTMVSADDSPPTDRPNLSKDFLAGTAQEDWIPLRPPEFYTEQRIDLVLGTRVSRLEPGKRQVATENGQTYQYGALLIATGADPVHLDIPGANPGQVQYLRTFSDSKAIVARVSSAKRVLVVGASFIGLEVAASLRNRNVDVHVVAPESQPLERVMGADVGKFIRSVHEGHGVTFHLGATVKHVAGKTVTLSDGGTVDADFIVAGVGVRPSIGFAEEAGLRMDRGIAVDEYLTTSAPGVFAAGDVARWPDPHTGDRIRVEHWVVAERQGQTAAKNILGQRQPFDTVPFFWSQHYDVVINYVGHAEKWDTAEIDGNLDAQDCMVTYKRGGRVLAVATIGRDKASLEAEAKMEEAIR
jgi:NADPH-dependent 2,4-dienoyl-CoA reductase/sulfur reductase-like enzyme/nitrite reductase/ring-hydroxylating ferredoxin subunit